MAKVSHRDAKNEIFQPWLATFTKTEHSTHTMPKAKRSAPKSTSNGAPKAKRADGKASTAY
jgi:hypothetical protein